MDAVTANSVTDESLSKKQKETDETKDVLEKLESRDVLIEMLVLLPPESIFSLMCVSKRWITILTDSLFLRCYSAAARRRSGSAHVVAFFQRLTDSNLNLPGKHCNTLPISIPNRNLIEAVPKKFGYFINSSNGLILCSHEDRRCLYHVINPVTRMYKSLPPAPRNNNLPISTGLICEENATTLAPIYTVVRAGLHLLPYKYNIMYIDTYSSITGVWSDPRILTASEPFLLLRRPPLVANGIFHWYSTDWRLAVYDPKDVESHLQLIQLPLCGMTYSNAVTRSGVDGSLWYGGMGGCGRMKFFVLPKREGDSYGREEWMLIYDISLVSVWNAKSSASAVLESIIPPLNSQMEMVAVLRYKSAVFYFNLETMSIEKVNYYGRCSRDEDNHLCPYIHSSYLSSYARIL